MRWDLSRNCDAQIINIMNKHEVRGNVLLPISPLCKTDLA